MVIGVRKGSIKELTPPLNKARMPSFTGEIKVQEKDRIFYVIRGVVFFTGVFIGIVFAWLHVSDYAPYYFTPYPSSDRYIVDSGTLSEVNIRKGSDYLILTKDNGTKIELEDFRGFDDLQESYGVEKFQAKVWWFPLKYSSRGWVAKMEMDAKGVIPEAEQKSIYKQMTQNLLNIDTILIFIIYILFAVIWEFILQYKSYKQREKSLD
jgi:hypothetical protein